MLRKELVIAFLMIFTLGAFADTEYVPGEIIVQFKDNTVKLSTAGTGKSKTEKMEPGSESLRALNARYKVHAFKHLSEKGHRKKKTRTGKIVDVPDLSNIFLFKFSTFESVTSAVDDYVKDPAVEYATPNYIMTVCATPNDPSYIAGGGSPVNDPNQWGLYTIRCLPVGSGESAWDITTGTNEVKLAIIDTGVNYNHEDLITRVDSLEGYRFVTPESSDPMDDFGHGTHVAGIAAAASNNGKGVAGVDWNCRIIPIKCFDSNGDGTNFDIIQGIEWAVSKDANVINMSFASTINNIFVHQAISYASTMDVVLVAAADNYSTSQKFYPAAYPEVIAVAATGPLDYLTGYSNFGTWVDVTAPGGTISPVDPYYKYEIYSTWPFNSSSPPWSPSNTAYWWQEGTSMATPFVSGLACLILAKYPGSSTTEVAARIVDYSDGIDAINPSRTGQIGKGRINAFASLGGLHAHISNPANKATVIGTATIIGNASGEGFDHYTVETGEGTSPTSWVTLETGTMPLLHSALATFDVTGFDAYFTVRLTINDLVSTEAKITFHAGSLNPPLLQSKAQYGPNPFNPNKESILIKYVLTRNSDVYIYFFDVNGNLIDRRYYGSGSIGGQQGTNRVYWDGKVYNGDVVANGVYIMKIFSEERTIGDGKIVVLK